MASRAIHAVQAAGIEHRVIRHGPGFVSITAWLVIADERLAGRGITLGAGQPGVAIVAVADGSRARRASSR